MGYQYTLGDKNLSIQLCSRPTHAEITSAFLVPFLTRKEVECDPYLQQSFSNIILNVSKLETEKGKPLGFLEKSRVIMRDISTLGKNQIIRNNDVVKCTIVIQVMIYCQEIFSVKDRESGILIQGNDNGLIKDVCHLVRFERVGSLAVGPNRSREDWRGNEFCLEGWKITD